MEIPLRGPTYPLSCLAFERSIRPGTAHRHARTPSSRRISPLYPESAPTCRPSNKQSALSSSALMPVGWDQSGAPAARLEPQVRAGRRASDAKMAEPVVWLRHLGWLDYAALGFFSALAAGLGAAFFAVPALPLEANSCLTLAVMAFRSTL